MSHRAGRDGVARVHRVVAGAGVVAGIDRGSLLTRCVALVVRNARLSCGGNFTHPRAFVASILFAASVLVVGVALPRWFGVTARIEARTLRVLGVGSCAVRATKSIRHNVWRTASPSQPIRQNGKDIYGEHSPVRPLGTWTLRFVD